MEIINLDIPGVLVIKPKVFEDNRGYFFETFNEKTLAEHGFTETFVQDNESKSKKGVLRGMHMQLPPHTQGKLVRVIKGAVLDVAADLRIGSPTYGKWVSAKLTEVNKHQMWIPPGFAHGFITLEDNTIFSYKCTRLYNKESEVCIRWDDPDLNINWPLNDPILTQRDKLGIFLKDFENPFKD